MKWRGSELTVSDGREVLLTLGRPACGGAAFGQHGDLGAEVIAVAADGWLLVLSVSAQEPLQHPSAPLTLNLRLHLCRRAGGQTLRRMVNILKNCFFFFSV